MTVSRNDEWIRLAALNNRDEIRFTAEFLQVLGDLGWEAKAFCGHLLGLWYDPFEHMLGYSSGDAKSSADQPGSFRCNLLEEAQDVVEYWAVTWSENGHLHDPPHKAGTGLNLGIEWYRDVLRSKLVSISLPKRLLEAYRDAAIQKFPVWKGHK